MKPSTTLTLILLLFPLCSSSSAILPSQLTTSTRFSDECTQAVQCILNAPENETCSRVPIPASSVTLFGIDGNFELTALRKGVWAYTEGGYNSMLLTAGRRLVVIDSPQAQGATVNTTRLPDAITQVLNGTVPYRIDLIYSHSHFDHIGTSRVLTNFLRERYGNAKLLVWGTAETYDIIKRSVTNRSVLPNVRIGKKGNTLRLSRSLKVRLDVVGGHTSSDLRIYIPKSRDGAGIVMYVDVVFPNFAPPFNFAITQDLGLYVRNQKELLELDFETFIGGHIGLGNKEDVSENLMYTEFVIDAAVRVTGSISVEAQLEAGVGNFFNPTAVEFGNMFFPFVAVLRPLEMEACFRLVLAEWGCRLGGVDLVARGHCFTALQYVLLEL